jgi:micrococcal nuclease
MIVSMAKVAYGLVAVVVGGMGVTAAVAMAGPGGDDAVVVGVVDGDTIDVTIGDRQERVRLLNIDTPESVDPDEPVQCLGPEATAFLADLLPVGTAVRLEYDEVRTDRYDRTLAGVLLGDRLVNAEIARAGLAAVVVVDENVRFLPPVEDAVAQARVDGVGLFDEEIACTVPGLVAELDRTVVANPTAEPPGAAPATAFVDAARTPRLVADAASGLVRVLAAVDDPLVAALDIADRERHGAHVDEVRDAALDDYSRLTAEAARREAADLEARRAEEARVAEEARQAEAARVAEESRRAEERAAADRRRAEERVRNDDSSSRSGGGSGGGGSAGPGGGGGSTDGGYTGPRCYEPGGVVWHPC